MPQAVGDRNGLLPRVWSKVLDTIVGCFFFKRGIQRSGSFIIWIVQLERATPATSRGRYAMFCKRNMLFFFLMVQIRAKTKRKETKQWKHSSGASTFKTIVGKFLDSHLANNIKFVLMTAFFFMNVTSKRQQDVWFGWSRWAFRICSNIMNHLTSAMKGCQRLTSKYQSYINLTLKF